MCLVGRTPIDFLRLLAIGYEDISEYCLGAPGEPPGADNLNAVYRAWLIERYGISIPAMASEIVGEVPDELSKASDDPFWRWVRNAQEERDSRA